MPVVVGVVFSQGGQVYPFDPDGLELAWNERVVCNTPRGREYGRVVQPNHEVAAETIFGPLKKVLRRASAQDEETRRLQREQSRKAMATFKRVTKERGIVAKPFAAEMTFDGGRVVLTFGAEEKTDLPTSGTSCRASSGSGSSCARSVRGRAPARWAAAACAATSCARRASRRTRTRSRCGWRRTRTCR